MHNNVLLWSALNLLKPNCPNHTALDAIKSMALCPLSMLHMNLVQVDFFPGGGARAQEHSHSVSLQFHLVLFRISNVLFIPFIKKVLHLPILGVEHRL